MYIAGPFPGPGVAASLVPRSHFRLSSYQESYDPNAQYTRSGYNIIEQHLQITECTVESGIQLERIRRRSKRTFIEEVRI